MKIEHKIFESEVKAFDDENLIVEHFISTEHKDRGGDIMRAKGMKIVGKPVVLLLHGRGTMGSEPVAKPLSITVDEYKGQPGVLARTQFYPDETGQRLYGKSKGGFFPNWSIGYAVDEAKDIVETGKYAGRDVTKWQLLEYSLVGVPMNPFAQTIKEFLDKNEDPKGPFEVPESHWFGVVEEKTCTGCGACANHGTCPTCKGPVTYFAKGEDLLGKACEKCDPEKFAELTKAIAPPHPFQIEEDPPPTDPPAEPTLKDLCDSIQIVADNVSRLSLDFIKATGRIDELSKAMEPLLKTLPPKPDGGEMGDEEHTDNPPEKKTPPRLVIVREEESPEAKKQAQRAKILAVAREVLGEAAKQEIDRMKGRVH